MIKKILSTLLIGAMMTASLVGCGSQVTTETSNNTNVNQEKTTVAVETKTKETTLATQAPTEATTAAPVFESITSPEGDTYPSGEVNNKVVVALKKAGFDTSKYETSYIEYVNAGTPDQKIYVAINYDGEAAIISDYNNKRDDEILSSKLSESGNKYAQDEVKGLAPTFDYNNDGILDEAECIIAGIFYDTETTYNFEAVFSGEANPVRHLN